MFIALLLLLCTTVAKASDFEYNGIYYNITDYETHTVDVTSGDVIYDLAGRKVKNPTKGIYIVNGEKISVK